jgi:hypothetical protein
VLIIDDNPRMAADAERELVDAFERDPSIDLEVRTVNDFDHGLTTVKNGECDLVVLDVRKDKTATTSEDRTTGDRVYADIRKVRFLPIVFWTALPGEVSHRKMPPLVEVLKKDDLELMPNAVLNAIDSGAAEAMTQIEDLVANVMRDHMWNELAPNWAEETGGGKPDEIAHILITRVGHALQDRALPELTRKPSHCYLYPFVSTKYQPGDLLRAKKTEVPEWWVILTPACDLAHEGKADYILLGKASLLQGHPKFQAWSKTQSKNDWNELNKVLSGKISRYHYLPKFREIPDLLLDLENTRSLPIKDLGGLDRIASLVAPYSEALLAKHSHFRGRVGLPDLDSDAVKERLKGELVGESSATIDLAARGSLRRIPCSPKAVEISRGYVGVVGSAVGEHSGASG